MLKVRSFYVSSLRIPLEHPITFWLCTSLDLSDEAKSTHEKLRTPVFTLFLPQENSVVEQKIDFDLGFSEYCITSESPMNKHAHIGRWIVFVGKQVNIFRYEFQTALFLNEMIILYSNLQIENNNKRQERITWKTSSNIQAIVTFLSPVYSHKWKSIFIKNSIDFEEFFHHVIQKLKLTIQSGWLKWIVLIVGRGIGMMWNRTL